jgi:hypothetical protein
MRVCAPCITYYFDLIDLIESNLYSAHTQGKARQGKANFTVSVNNRELFLTVDKSKVHRMLMALDRRSGLFPEGVTLFLR